MQTIHYGFDTDVRRSGHAACWCPPWQAIVQFGGWPPSEELRRTIHREGARCPLYVLPLTAVGRAAVRAERRRCRDGEWLAERLSRHRARSKPPQHPHEASRSSTSADASPSLHSSPACAAALDRRGATRRQQQQQQHTRRHSSFAAGSEALSDKGRGQPHDTAVTGAPACGCGPYLDAAAHGSSPPLTVAQVARTRMAHVLSGCGHHHPSFWHTRLGSGSGSAGAAAAADAAAHGCGGNEDAGGSGCASSSESFLSDTTTATPAASEDESGASSDDSSSSTSTSESSTDNDDGDDSESGDENAARLQGGAADAAAATAPSATLTRESLPTAAAEVRLGFSSGGGGTSSYASSSRGEVFGAPTTATAAAVAASGHARLHQAEPLPISADLFPIPGKPQNVQKGASPQVPPRQPRPLHWRCVRPAVAPRSRHGHQLLYCAGSLYVMGGSYWAQGGALASSDMRYDLRRHAWQQMESLLPPRFCAAAAVSNATDEEAPTRVVYQFGGSDFTSTLSAGLFRLWLPSGAAEELPQYGAAPRAQFKGVLVCDVQRERSWAERRHSTTTTGGSGGGGGGLAAEGRLFYLDGYQDGRPMAPALRSYQLETGVWRRLCPSPDLTRSQLSSVLYAREEMEGSGGDDDKAATLRDSAGTTLAAAHHQSPTTTTTTVTSESDRDEAAAAAAAAAEVTTRATGEEADANRANRTESGVTPPSPPLPEPLVQKLGTRLLRFEVMGGMPSRRGRQRRSRLCHAFDVASLSFDYAHALPVPGLSAHALVLLPDNAAALLRCGARPPPPPPLPGGQQEALGGLAGPPPPTQVQPLQDAQTLHDGPAPLALLLATRPPYLLDQQPPRAERRAVAAAAVDAESAAAARAEEWWAGYASRLMECAQRHRHLLHARPQSAAATAATRPETRRHPPACGLCPPPHRQHGLPRHRHRHHHHHHHHPLASATATHTNNNATTTSTAVDSSTSLFLVRAVCVGGNEDLPSGEQNNLGSPCGWVYLLGWRPRTLTETARVELERRKIAYKLTAAPQDELLEELF